MLGKRNLPRVRTDQPLASYTMPPPATDKSDWYDPFPAWDRQRYAAACPEAHIYVWSVFAPVYVAAGVFLCLMLILSAVALLLADVSAKWGAEAAALHSSSWLCRRDVFSGSATIASCAILSTVLLLTCSFAPVLHRAQLWLPRAAIRYWFGAAIFLAFGLFGLHVSVVDCLIRSSDVMNNLYLHAIALAIELATGVAMICGMCFL